MARHVRKGDTVVVTSGKNKGQRGKVLRVLHKTNRVVIERVAMVKRHTKPSQKSPADLCAGSPAARPSSTTRANRSNSMSRISRRWWGIASRNRPKWA